MNQKRIVCISAAVCGLIILVHSSYAQGTAFTYQGRLNDANGPVTGSYDLAVTLFGVNFGGVALADQVTNTATIVSNGLFTTMIDFGDTPFASGGNRWLEISVRTNGSSVAFETLIPRQPLTPVPYALFAMTPGGPQGPQGIPGINGTSGVDGFNGVDGAPGPSGPAGSSDAIAPTNYPSLDGTNTFTGTNTFAEMVLATNANNIFAGIFSGDGAGLTNISWASLATPPPGMVLIPAGSFTMGDMLDGASDAIPTDIYVSAFYMDVNLVSLSQWQSVYFWATNHGYDFVNSGAGKAWNHPVQTVDWYDMVKWCNARSQQAGRTPVYYLDADFTQVYTSGETDAIYPNWAAIGYRLPTESEWEKAARGGLSTQRFPWGNVITENLACYNASIATDYDLGPDGYNPAFTNGVTPYTSPVGSFAPNAYGLFDMAGNVAELCWDWYGAPYGQPSANNPSGPVTGESRVQRGGDWGGNASGCKSASRSATVANVANAGSGFRTALP